MRDFSYRRPDSLDEAQRLARVDGAMPLAGGQTLLRDMKLGLHFPATLVDITGLIPRNIEFRENAISIGAGATHAEVAQSPVLHRHLPVLAALAGHIGDPAVRHRGTLGGAVAANEPAGDYPAACLALDATLHTTKRDIAAADFFIGDHRTALEPGEIVRSATFPLARRASYVKFLNPAARYAMVGVFAAVVTMVALAWRSPAPTWMALFDGMTRSRRSPLHSFLNASEAFVYRMSVSRRTS